MITIMELEGIFKANNLTDKEKSKIVASFKLMSFSDRQILFSIFKEFPEYFSVFFSLLKDKMALNKTSITKINAILKKEEMLLSNALKKS